MRCGLQKKIITCKCGRLPKGELRQENAEPFVKSNEVNDEEAPQIVCR